jgi:hypothetical protein
MMIALLFFISSIRAEAQIIPGEMITIPAGSFVMGNDKGSWEEKPQALALATRILSDFVWPDK